MHYSLTLRRPGRLGYTQALALQRSVHGQVLAGAAPMTVIVLEHDPVITMTRRAHARGNLLADAGTLEAMGVQIASTDRGGEATYHGPGQVVMYPILRLRDCRLNVRQYVAMLEQVLIDTLGVFGITGRRDADAVGVWVDRPDDEPGKIAAIGVRVRRWVTLHGVALNVRPNMEHFKLIMPCGLTRPVSSMAQLLGPDCPTVEQVGDMLISQLDKHLSTSDRSGYLRGDRQSGG